MRRVWATGLKNHTVSQNLTEFKKFIKSSIIYITNISGRPL